MYCDYILSMMMFLVVGTACSQEPQQASCRNIYHSQVEKQTEVV